MPDWVTFAWSVICAVVAAVVFTAGIAVTFYVSVKVELALAKQKIEDLDSANKKHFADRDDIKEAVDERFQKLMQEVHEIQRRLDRWEGEDAAKDARPRRTS